MVDKITTRNVLFNLIKVDNLYTGDMYFKSKRVLTFKGIGREGMFDDLTIYNKQLEQDMLDYLKAEGFSEILIDAQTFVVEAFFIYESKHIMKSLGKSKLDAYLAKLEETTYLNTEESKQNSILFFFETDSDLEMLFLNKKEVTEQLIADFYTESPIGKEFKGLYAVYYTEANDLNLEDLTKQVKIVH